MASTRTEPSNEAELSSKLGLFFKLPAEIRLLIWETLFMEIPFQTQRTRKQTYAPTNRLSILRCSRALYNEISHHLYKPLTYNLTIYSHCSEGWWMKVTIVFGNTTVWWRLKDAEDVRQHISNFPFAKFHEPRINVQIRPSRTHGPGRIVCLWQKINFLVDILQELQCPPHVQVTLYGGWHEGEKARQSILYTKGYRPDHDIAVLPFTRLPKSQWDYTLYDHLDAVVSSEPEGPEHSLLYRLKIGEAFDSAEIDSLCLDTRIFLDTALDKTVGPTADLLRLSRFQHWYQAGNEWNVSYEEQFLAGLVNHLPVVIKHIRDFLLH